MIMKLIQSFLLQACRNHHPFTSRERNLFGEISCNHVFSVNSNWNITQAQFQFNSIKWRQQCETRSDLLFAAMYRSFTEKSVFAVESQYVYIYNSQNDSEYTETAAQVRYATLQAWQWKTGWRSLGGWSFSYLFRQKWNPLLKKPMLQLKVDEIPQQLLAKTSILHINIVYHV